MTFTLSGSLAQHVEVMRLTQREIYEQFGGDLDGTDPEATAVVLVDRGNQLAYVLEGDIAAFASNLRNVTAVHDAKITDNLTPGMEARRYYGGEMEWRTVVSVEDVGAALTGHSRRRVHFTDGTHTNTTAHTRWEVRR